MICIYVSRKFHCFNFGEFKNGFPNRPDNFISFGNSTDRIYNLKRMNINRNNHTRKCIFMQLFFEFHIVIAFCNWINVSIFFNLRKSCFFIDCYNLCVIFYDRKCTNIILIIF